MHQNPLWNLHDQRFYPNALRPGLYAAAAALVRRGWVRKERCGPTQAVYHLTTAGLPAALEAWRELYPQQVEPIRRALNLA